MGMREREEAFLPHRQAFYDSTFQYNKCLEAAKGPLNRNVDDASANYLPGPQELRQRLADLQWLKACDFDARLIESVMAHDMPVITEIRELFENGLSPDEITKALAPFLIYEGPEIGTA